MSKSFFFSCNVQQSKNLQTWQMMLFSIYSGQFHASHVPVEKSMQVYWKPTREKYRRGSNLCMCYAIDMLYRWAIINCSQSRQWYYKTHDDLSNPRAGWNTKWSCKKSEATIIIWGQNESKLNRPFLTRSEFIKTRICLSVSKIKQAGKGCMKRITSKVASGKTIENLNI